MLDALSIICHFEHTNILNTEKRARVLAALIEGNSIRAISRMTGFSRNTINKLLVELGEACSMHQDNVFRNLNCKRLQCDEIWSFLGRKQKTVTPENKENGWGDVWTWVALDADTKLVPTWYVGTRDASAAYQFIHDLKQRLANRVQLTIDGQKACLMAVGDASDCDIDHAMLQKIYGVAPTDSAEIRYSSTQCVGARKAIISERPERRHVSTSFVERQNLTMRMSMRRFTRLTNAFSIKVENHEHAIAIHYMAYNFHKIHGSLRVTPAMAAGVSGHVWELAEIIALLDKRQLKLGHYQRKSYPQASHGLAPS